MIASGYPTGTVAVELLTFAMGILAPGTEIKNVRGDKIGIAEQAIEKLMLAKSELAVMFFNDGGTS